MDQIKARKITRSAERAVAKFLSEQSQRPEAQPTIEPQAQPTVKFEPQPTVKTSALIRACRYLFNLHSRKRKVVFFSVFGILCAIAITFGVTMVKIPPVAKSESVTTQDG